jgi:hypothetical protein
MHKTQHLECMGDDVPYNCGDSVGRPQKGGYAGNGHLRPPALPLILARSPGGSKCRQQHSRAIRGSNTVHETLTSSSKVINEAVPFKFGRLQPSSQLGGRTASNLKVAGEFPTSAAPVHFGLYRPSTETGLSSSIHGYKSLCSS